MKFLFWLLGLSVLAVALTLATHNPGYVMLFYPPYRVEMPLSLFVIALLLLYVALYLALRLVFATMRLPEYVRNFRNERARGKGRKALQEALTAFFEGRYASAEQAAVQAMELGEESGLNPIIAASAAHELHEYGKRDAYLEEATARPVGEATMRLIATAKFNLDQQQPRAALDALKELRNSGVRDHTGALLMELRGQQQARNWNAVLEVLGQLEKRHAMDATAVENLRQQAWLELIRTDSHSGPDLHRVWQSLPRETRLQNKISTAAARAFIQLGEQEIAREIITDSLQEEWDSDLSLLFGDCISGNVASQIEQAERWLQTHGQDAGLLLALGKLCLHQQLWGQAKNYLDASIGINPSRAAYMELGELSELLQKPEDALRYFRRAMEL